ncbi:hypothetical protein DL766_004486 [Monosporascus sp. MC13-8B]|uniref:Uncharacterized protein n=1 Tax=Monosporascus cannonballus TaxID=155416 RepID=A0ABY0GZX9_9PEZI|nr:hypothetical protein DL762_007181 [Monosporascus cannonballus]RYO86137.1 hypothetical protein DL763_006830 [Monosporascus cannonballus]RYP31178.1 hypothetical protein DL766_004486 [Monosporascus sp. MC13-8B]
MAVMITSREDSFQKEFFSYSDVSAGSLTPGLMSKEGGERLRQGHKLMEGLAWKKAADQGYGWREDKANGFPACELRVKPVKMAVLSGKFVEPAEGESDNEVGDDDDSDSGSGDQRVPISDEFVSLSDLERDEDEEPQHAQGQAQQQEHAAPLGRPGDEDTVITDVEPEVPAAGQQSPIGGDDLSARITQLIRQLPSSLGSTIPSTPSSSSAAALPTSSSAAMPRSSSAPNYSSALESPGSVIPPSAAGLFVLLEQSDEGGSIDSEAKESAALGGTGMGRRAASDAVGNVPMELVMNDSTTARFADIIRATRRRCPDLILGEVPAPLVSRDIVYGLFRAYGGETEEKKEEFMGRKRTTAWLTTFPSILPHLNQF